MSFLKLNVDAHLHDDGRWGYGMVLRREDAALERQLRFSRALMMYHWKRLLVFVKL
jgi:hypothetical protein